jgi:hypothetical protein
MLSTWIPLFVATLALVGITLTVITQWRSFNRQLAANHRLKMAEMRQAWIDDLRGAMCEFQSFGVTPELNQLQQREFYQAGTKIELLMNPGDPDYTDLHNRMYAFLAADSISEKFSANAPYIAVCQRIIKREWDRLKTEARPEHLGG